MKTKILLLTLVTSLSGCATVDEGAVIGGVAGGLLGSMVGGGTGNIAATAVGAVVGSQVLSTRRNQQYPTRYRDGTNPIYERTGGCEGELYIDGNYNPPAAQQHCRGRLDRDRRFQQQYEHDAYQRGLKGLR